MPEVNASAVLKEFWPEPNGEGQEPGRFEPESFALYPAWFNFLHEQQELHGLLNLLCRAARAEIGALLIADGEHLRYRFSAAHGVSCQESALASMLWPHARKLKTAGKSLTEPFTLPAEILRIRPEFSLERRLGFLSLSYYPLLTGHHLLGAVLIGNRRESVDFTPQDLQRLQRAARGIQPRLERIQLCQAVRALFLNSVRAFVSAIEAKDPYTHGHSERVTAYALSMAETHDWNPQIVETLRLAALLHDVGKIGIPEAILTKPGSLTPEEYAVIQKHPQIGVRIISKIPQLKNTLTGILTHHERFDGQGYPQGLAGKKIPLLGRLIAVADAYDAMTSERPYRRALSPDHALREIERQQGRQFDPGMVAAFFQAVKVGAIL